jgi:hypothetical protein
MRERAAIVHLEHVLGALADARAVPGQMRDHARAMMVKYVVPAWGIQI